MHTKIKTKVAVVILLSGMLAISWHLRSLVEVKRPQIPAPAQTGTEVPVVSDTIADSPTSRSGTPQKNEAKPTGISSPTSPNIAKQATTQTAVHTTNPDAVLAYARSHNLAVTYQAKASNTVVLAIDSSSPVLQDLSQAVPGSVARPDYVYHPAATATDPYFSSQWNLNEAKVPDAWDITTGSTSVTLAIIDSGVLFSQTINGTTYTQPDFPNSRRWLNSAEQGTTQSGDHCWTGTPADKSTNNCDDDQNGYNDDWRGWDFMGGFRGASAACPNRNDPSTYQASGDSTYLTDDNDPQPYSCDNPLHPTFLNKTDYSGSCGAYVGACTVGHGTEVASMAAADTNNGDLVAGVDQNVKLMNLRIFDGYGYTDSTRIAAAVDYARENGADVINLSLGFTPCTDGFSDTTIETALAAAKTAGVTVVASSGNEGGSIVCYPGSSSNVIGVGATDSNTHRASFSSYGSALDIVAPGQSVLAANAPTTYLNSNLVTTSGTSFSSPTVAGVASLIKAVAPSATPDEVHDFIALRGDITADMNYMPYNTEFGYGRLNAYTSVRTASGQLPIYRLRSIYTGDDTILTDIVRRNEILENSKRLTTSIVDWSNDGSPILTLMEQRVP